MERPIPHPTNISKTFWDGCKDGRLLIQKCNDCGYHIYFPAYACPQCLSSNLDWIEASGRGSVHTLTVIERGAGPAFEDESPFVVALIELEEGPIMMSNVIGCPPYEVKIGDCVEVTFRTVADGVTLPAFTKTGKGA